MCPGNTLLVTSQGVLGTGCGLGGASFRGHPTGLDSMALSLESGTGNGVFTAGWRGQKEALGRRLLGLLCLPSVACFPAHPRSGLWLCRS